MSLPPSQGSARTGIALSAGAMRKTINSVQSLAQQPHLHVKLQFVFLSVRTGRTTNLKLLVVFIHLKFSAGTPLRLNRSGQFCALILGNLTVGERRRD
jgi:hypothetical protein